MNQLFVKIEFPYEPRITSYNVCYTKLLREVHKGQRKLFDDARCFFYITNDFRKAAEAIVYEANHRCNQENLFAQLKGDARSLSAPVDTLLSNWAYMVIASLAWSLKAWMALTLPEEGRDAEERRAEKYKLLRMEFTTFRRAFMAVPASYNFV